LPAADEGVDEHEADLRRRPAHVDGADDVTALPHAAAKVASHVPRFQRHLVTYLRPVLLTHYDRK
jgi:hypothetical protein